MEDLRICRNCGKSAEDAVEFCPYCGVSLADKEVDDVSCDPDVLKDSSSDCADDFTSINCEKSKENKKSKCNLTRKQKSELIKKSISLAICTLLFILSFCPVVNVSSFFGTEYDAIETGFSGVDLFVLTCASFCNYNSNDDSAELHRLYENARKADEKLAQRAYLLNTRDVRKETIGNAVLNHSSKMAWYVYSYSQSEWTSASRWGLLNSGILSLAYIAVSCTMFAFSLIELLVFVKEITGKGSVKAKRFENYFYLAPILLFISLALITNVFIGNYAICLILRLTIECGCIAFFLAKMWLESKQKSDIRQKIMSTVVVALVILIVGCCFSALFESYSYKKDDDGRKYLYVIERKTKRIFTSVDDAYGWAYHLDVVWTDEDIRQFYIETNAGSEAMVRSVLYRQLKDNNLTKGGLKTLSVGSGIITIVLSLCGFIVFAMLYPSYKLKRYSYVAMVMLLIAVLFLFALCVTIAAYVNDYMYKNDLYQYRQSIGSGLACMVIFSIGLVATYDSLERKQKINGLLRKFGYGGGEISALDDSIENNFQTHEEAVETRKRRIRATLQGKTKFKKKQ